VLIQSGIGGLAARLDERRDDPSSEGWSKPWIATTVRQAAKERIAA
jgi:hypothetical protein